MHACSAFITQNINCEYMLHHLDEAVLTSTHNLYFGSKIRNIGLHPVHPILLSKSRVWRGRGKYYMDMLS